MKDSQGNKITIGTKLRSPSRHCRREIVCMALNKDFGMFKPMKQFRDKAIPIKITADEMARSNWVDVEKIEKDVK